MEPPFWWMALGKAETCEIDCGQRSAACERGRQWERGRDRERGERRAERNVEADGRERQIFEREKKLNK